MVTETVTQAIKWSNQQFSQSLKHADTDFSNNNLPHIHLQSWSQACARHLCFSYKITFLLLPPHHQSIILTVMCIHPQSPILSQEKPRYKTFLIYPFSFHKRGPATENCSVYNNICCNKPRHTHTHPNRVHVSIIRSINVCPQAEVPRWQARHLGLRVQLWLGHGRRCLSP